MKIALGVYAIIAALCIPVYGGLFFGNSEVKTPMTEVASAASDETLEQYLGPNTWIPDLYNTFAMKGTVYLLPSQAQPDFMSVPLQFPDQVFSVYRVHSDSNPNPTNGLVLPRVSFYWDKLSDPNVQGFIASTYATYCPDLNCPTVTVDVTSDSITISTAHPKGKNPFRD